MSSLPLAPHSHIRSKFRLDLFLPRVRPQPPAPVATPLNVILEFSMPTKNSHSLNRRLLRLLNAAARRTEYSKPILRHRIASASLIVISMLWPLQAKQPVSSQTDTTAKPAYPASMQTFQIASHGALLNAFVYVAAGAGPHPANSSSAWLPRQRTKPGSGARYSPRRLGCLRLPPGLRQTVKRLFTVR